MIASDGTVEGGARAAGALLRQEPQPTAVACYNDLVAIGVLRTLRQAGIAVPGELSVVGFDDIELAAWTDPPLTTVRQPTGELGCRAVERIAAALAGSAPTPSLEILSPSLVVRGTTAPPRGAIGQGTT